MRGSVGRYAIGTQNTRAGYMKSASSRSRVLVLVAFVWLQSFNGGSFAFGSYSQAIKERLGFEQQSLDTVSFFAILGCTFGVVPSLLLNLRVPPWLIVLIGLAHSSLGYTLTWLAISRPRPTAAVWQMSTLQFLLGNSLIFTETAALVTCVSLFPAKQRGLVVGMLKAFLGLSLSILLQILGLICVDDQVCIPLVLAWLPQLLSAVPILLLVLVYKMQPSSSSEVIEDENVTAKLNFLMGVVVILATYMLGVLVLEKSLGFSQLVRSIACILMLLILASPFIAILKLESGSSEAETGLLPDSQDENERNSLSTKQALMSLDFWLLFLVLLIGSGATTTVETNVAQLGNALGYPSQVVNLCISLSSIMTCIGRMSSGWISDYFAHNHGISRPLFAAIAMVSIALGTFLGSSAVSGALYVIPVFIGLAEGALWCLLVVTLSEVFGLGSFGTMINVLVLACPPGSYIFSVLIVGNLYDTEARGTLMCKGSQCFRVSFLILSFSCILGALLSGIVAYRTRRVYEKRG